MILLLELALVLSLVLGLLVALVLVAVKDAARSHSGKPEFVMWTDLGSTTLAVCN